MLRESKIERIDWVCVSSLWMLVEIVGRSKREVGRERERGGRERERASLCWVSSLGMLGVSAR
jgi:hypothetical protein